MHLVTGTEQTRTEHSSGAAATGVTISVGIPAVLFLWGLFQFGADAVSWSGAIIWGIVAAAGFLLVMAAGRALDSTRMDFADMLGSMFTRPGTSASQWTGTIVHFVVGALLALTYVYALALVDWPANWATGLTWGLVVWVHWLILLTSIGAVHPAIRHGDQHDPGTGGMNFGRSTPWISLAAHAVYGVLLGALYRGFPLT